MSAAVPRVAGPAVCHLVDRLQQVPDRLRVVFTFDAPAALTRTDIAAEIATADARDVIAALADDLAIAPRCTTREVFRAAAQRVRAAHRTKGPGVVPPDPLALTGEPEGPELDLVVPAIDTGAEFRRSAGVAPITGCRERGERRCRPPVVA